LGEYTTMVFQIWLSLVYTIIIDLSEFYWTINLVNVIENKLLDKF